MKKKKEQKPLTIEERKERAWKAKDISCRFPSFGAPTYRFEVGESVFLGGLQNCVVDDIRAGDDGETYYGIAYDEEDHTGYIWRPWYDVRPTSIKQGETNFTENEKIDIRFYNQDIESLVNKYYLSGVEMDPPYQRDYVWDDKDKESLLDSIFQHIEIGKFAFVTRDWTSEKHFEILDGKQRLSTLLDFYENRLPYRGAYFNDLSSRDRYTFLHTNVTVGETGELTQEQIYRYFCVMNKAGRVMDEEHLRKVQGMANAAHALPAGEEQDEPER